MNVLDRINPFAPKNDPLSGEKEAMKKKEQELYSLGVEAKGQYDTGILGLGQEKALGEYGTATQKIAQDYASKTPGASESFKQSMQDHFIIDAQIMRESMRSNTFAKSLQAFGLSLDETRKMIELHQKEHQKSVEAYSTLMSTIGTVIGAFYGGGTGAAVGGKIGQSVGAEVAPQ